jgi:hypothetical protein
MRIVFPIKIILPGMCRKIALGLLEASFEDDPFAELLSSAC